MKAHVRYKKGDLKNNQIEVIEKFLKFLQKEIPLKKDIRVDFITDRTGRMTTGSRQEGDKIKVLIKGRILIDILRTLSHEWTHSLEHQKLGVSDDKKIKDIGGPEENLANVLSGIMVKKFAKHNPQLEDTLYN